MYILQHLSDCMNESHVSALFNQKTLGSTSNFEDVNANNFDF